MLRELGCAVIDADALAHEVIEPGQPAFDEIVRSFGAGVVGGDGQIDREMLGAIVFADSAKRKRLNAIVHPRVIEETERRLVELVRPGGPAIGVVEAALLIEAGNVKQFDRVVVAWCRVEQQRERLLYRGLSPKEAEQRIAAQMPISEKRRRATDEIDCSGSVEHTREQVEQLFARFQKLAAK